MNEPTADPLHWNVALHLDAPGTPPATGWDDVLFTVNREDYSDPPLAVVSSLDGEELLRLRPLRTVLELDVLSVVGHLLDLHGDEADELVTLCARPLPTPAPLTMPQQTWPRPRGLPPEVADRLDFSRLPGLLTEAIRAKPADVQARILADGRGIAASSFDSAGVATFFAGGEVLTRLHWQELWPQPPSAA